MNQSFTHAPVLEKEVMQLLAPMSDETLLDVTLGLGGHAKRFLEMTAPNGKLFALDADSKNLEQAHEVLLDFDNRMELRHLNFGQITDLEFPPLDILFADLGLSSPHLDDPERGFSFRTDAPLDMRFDRTSGITASQLIKTSDEDALTKIFRGFGELYPQAKRLAKTLAGSDVLTTFHLKAIVEQTFGFKAKSLMPQVFQALRIAVNDELRSLQELLRVGPTLLAIGGRMGVISFHSLEDRMVKHTFRSLTTPVKDDITGKVAIAAPFELLTHKSVMPSDEEIERNPRARSAKFRVIRKVS